MADGDEVAIDAHGAGEDAVIERTLPNGLTQIDVALWKLPSPSYEYWADYAAAIEGTVPVLRFCQFMPGSVNPASAVDVAVPRDNLRTVQAGLGPVLDRLEATPRASHAEPDFSVLVPTSYRKLSAGVIRISANEYQVMMDFYSLTMYPTLQLEHFDLDSLVNPQIRVFVDPTAAHRLLTELRDMT